MLLLLLLMSMISIPLDSLILLKVLLLIYNPLLHLSICPLMLFLKSKPLFICNQLISWASILLFQMIKLPWLNMLDVQETFKELCKLLVSHLKLTEPLSNNIILLLNQLKPANFVQILAKVLDVVQQVHRPKKLQLGLRQHN